MASNEAEEEEKLTEENVNLMSEDKIEKKRKRKRRRGLLKEIRNQIEFYLSDANLRNDRYTREIMRKTGEEENGAGTGWIYLNEFFNYNRIKNLTNNVNTVRAALRQSNMLELNADESKVRRKVAIDEAKNVDECSIYVERLPSHATHQWIENTFANYGKIVYISLPLFRNCNQRKIKGFCFIEFEQPSSVAKVCEHYGANLSVNAAGGDGDAVAAISLMHSENEDNDDDHDEKQKEEDNDEKNGGEMKSDAQSSESSDDDEDDARKEKIINNRKRVNTAEDNNDDVKEEENFSRKRRRTSQDNNENNLTAGEQSSVEPQQQQQQKPHKTKNRRKAKKLTETMSVENEIEKINLRVLSKRDWLEYKRKYLELQKVNMKRLKQATKKLNLKCEQQPMSIEPFSVNWISDEDRGKVIKIIYTTKCEFVESLFRKTLREIFVNKLAYIDIIKDENKCSDERKCKRTCYLRFKCKADAQSALTDERLLELTNGSILKLDESEENEYWCRLYQCKQKKKAKKIKTEKKIDL